MDTTSIDKTAVPEVGASRLPAGSTLEIAPGVHIAHPQAEVNLPGLGDPRLGDTKAVSVVLENGELKEVPLLDRIKPKTVTVAAPNAGVATLEVQPAASPLSPVAPAAPVPAASAPVAQKPEPEEKA